MNISRWQPDAEARVAARRQHGRREEVPVGVPGGELLAGEPGAAAAARAARPARAQPLRWRQGGAASEYKSLYMRHSVA